MDNELAQLRDSILRAFPDSELTPATGHELASIRMLFPTVPDHYLSFLQHIGWGALGNRNFMIYSGPLDPSELIDEEAAAHVRGIVFFGDDLAGWMVGFDTRNEWRIVGVSSVTLRPLPEETRTVADFIAKRVSQSGME